MEKTSLAYQSLKNASYGALSFFVPVILSIVITPIFVRKLGVTDYGVYILTNTIIGILSLLDLGLISALVKYLSQYHAQQDAAALKRIAFSANSLYIVVGALGFLIFFALGKFFLGIFHITNQSQSHILIVFLLAGAYFFVNSANSVYTTIPQALQRFDISAKINLTQTIVLSLLNLVLVLLGLKLKAIMASNLLIMILVTLAYFVVGKKLLPELPFALAWDKSEIKKMYGYGIFAAVGNLGSSALNQLDRLIIPVFLGPVQLSYYSLPGNVAQKIPTVVSSFAGVWLLPLASSLQGSGEMDRLGQIHRKVMRNITIMSAAMAASIILFGQKILLYWLGPDFAANGRVVLPLVTVTYFILITFGPIYQFLLGINRERLAAAWSLSLAALNIALLLPLVRLYGINGAAWAFLLSVLPVYGMLYWTEKRIFGLPDIFKVYVVLYGKLLVTAIIFYPIVKFVLLPWTVDIVSLIIIGPLSVVLFLALYKLFGFVEQEDWQLFKQYLTQVRLRLRGTST